MFLKDILPILLNFSINLLIISLFICTIILCLTYNYSAEDFFKNNFTIIFLKIITYYSLFFVCIIQFFL